MPAIRCLDLALGTRSPPARPTTRPTPAPEADSECEAELKAACGFREVTRVGVLRCLDVLGERGRLLAQPVAQRWGAACYV